MGRSGTAGKLLKGERERESEKEREKDREGEREREDGWYSGLLACSNLRRTRALTCVTSRRSCRKTIPLVER